MLEVPAPTRLIDAQAVSRVLQRQALGLGAPWLHQEIASRMAQRLTVIRLQPERIIDWWAGAGAADELLAQAYPRAQRIAVEASSAWQQRTTAQRQLPWWSAKRWTAPPQPVLLEGASPPKSQLLWSNMMLHAAIDPVAVIERWHGLLEAGGFLMFSCLGPGSLLGLRQVYQQRLWPAPATDFVDMHDLGDMLVRAGFADPVMDQELLTLTWATPQALLDELRLLGGNAHPNRFAGLRTPGWKRQLLQSLEPLRGPDGRLQLHFEISYGHAFKAAPRVKVASEARISVDDMRTMARSGSSTTKLPGPPSVG
ncbi:MAG: class I SAM-dependent methyltransferase [Burkholderiaceae bacterium]